MGHHHRNIAPCSKCYLGSGTRNPMETSEEACSPAWCVEFSPYINGRGAHINPVIDNFVVVLGVCMWTWRFLPTTYRPELYHLVLFVLLIFATTHFPFALFYSFDSHLQSTLDVLELLKSAISFAILISFGLTPRVFCPIHPYDKTIGPSPEQEVHFFGRFIFFSWLHGVLKRAWYNDLEIEDLNPVPDIDTTETWFEKLQPGSDGEGLRWSRIFTTMWQSFMKLAITDSLEGCFALLTPYSLQLLLENLEDHNNGRSLSPWVYVFAYGVSILGMDLSKQGFFVYSCR